MKRIISLILSAVTASSLLASCAVNTSDGTVSISGSSSVEATEIAGWLDERLGSDYSGSVTLSVGADSGFDFSDFPDGGYMIRTIGNETAISASSAYDLDLAVRAFANNYAGTGDVYVTKGEGYRVKSMSIDGTDISEWSIVVETLGEEGFEENPAFAASELQAYIEKACGVKLPIEVRVGASENGGKGGVDDGRVIRIVQAPKDDELGKEGLHIYFDEGDLILRGGYKRGTMYAVYEFLEKYVGWRFFGLNDMTYVIESESLEIAGDIDHADDSVFPMRFQRTFDKTRYPSNVSIPVVNVNGNVSLSALLRNNSGGACGAAKYGYSEYNRSSVHTFATQLNGLFNEANPCYTDELLIEELGYALEATAMSFSEAYKHDQNMPYISIGPEDNTYYCKCKNCIKAFKEGGNALSSVYLGFINPAIEYANEKYPDMTYFTISYMDTHKPPKNIRPVENVYIVYCTDYMCMKHSLLDYDDCTSDLLTCGEVREYIAGWAELTDNLGAWMYYMNYCNALSPVGMLRTLRENLQFLDEMGVTLLTFETYDYGFGFDQLKNYVMSELFWNPYISDEEYDAMIREFMAAFYGDGWESVYEYLCIFEKSTKNARRCFSTLGDFPGVLPSDNNLNSFHNIADYAENHEYFLSLLDDAKYSANSAEQEARIEILKVHIYYFHLCATYNSDYRNGNDEERAAYEELYLYFCGLLTYYGRTSENLIGNLTNRVPDFSVEDLAANPSCYLW